MAANAPNLPPKGNQKPAGSADKDAKKESKPSKPRAPRQNYGFAKDAVIRLTSEEKKYRGKRLEMFEALQKSNGKTVEHFLETNKNENDPPRGWLRFFVQDNACTLEGGTKPEKKEEKAKA